MTPPPRLSVGAEALGDGVLHLVLALLVHPSAGCYAAADAISGFRDPGILEFTCVINDPELVNSANINTSLSVLAKRTESERFSGEQVSRARPP